MSDLVAGWSFRLVAKDGRWEVHTAVKPTDGLEVYFPIRDTEWAMPERCPATWLGEQCELTTPHEGQHRVESKANPGLFHRWLGVSGETKEPQ